MASERLDFNVGGTGRQASIQRAHLCVEFGERRGDCTRGPSVVADDQLSRFLGELLRARWIDSELSVTGCCAEAFEFAPPKPGMLIGRRAVSSAAPAMLPVGRSARGEPVRV
jgi:hypothetical protein